MCFKLALTYDCHCSVNLSNFIKLLPHWNVKFGVTKICVLGNGHLKWLQNKPSLIPFKMKAVVFMLTQFSRWESEAEVITDLRPTQQFKKNFNVSKMKN